ncbi:MAG: hypothetical protein KME60_31045 [Cyanomargarita calcarea GSE-NOS-MK-12-04C]|jgi:hypothetical protein|uniref:Uncharacterized protein n=1 Tax=Cyanomargarita calcarea GSE-NOS-MK-12-04C TaxID=2839659 RepID=A0A951UW80_9CYAN|nr:hypothetical protein [Cyanomargarita calcarea GSE-NOS-MK-12-04C]
MIESFAPSNFLIAIQQLSPSMLLLSFLMHGLLLVIPLSPSNKPNSVAKKEETPKLSLVPPKSGFFDARKTLVTPITKLPPKDSLPNGTAQIVAQLPPLPPSSGTVTQILPSAPFRLTTTETLPPSSARAVAATQTTLPTSFAVITPTAAPLTSPKVVKKVTFSPVKKTTATVAPFSDFPKYKNAQASSVCAASEIDSKYCQQTSDRLNLVLVFFANKLPALGYKAKKIADKSDVKVFQVSKAEQTQYLHFFVQDEQSTVVLLSQKQVKLKKFNNPVVDTVEKQVFDATFTSLYDELSWSEDLNFSQPGQFAESIPGIENIFGTVLGKTPDEVALIVKTKLEAQGFNASQRSIYGGGYLYEVKKGSFTKYITFAPTVDGTGAIVISWSKPLVELINSQGSQKR